MSKDTSGPAFPSPEYSNPAGDWMAGPFFGMTLRQWYAGMVMQGLMAAHGFPGFPLKGSDQDLATAAFVIADAMLAHEAKEVAG